MSKIGKIKYLFEKEHPTIEDKGREKTHCPWPGMWWRRMPSRERRISHLLFSVSDLWTERKVMDIHKRSLIPKVSEKKVKWQFFWIKFSPGHRNDSSWCLNNHKENRPTSWIWAFIFQLGNWGLSSEQLQDPMLNLCRFTCYSWFFPQITECSKCGRLHSLQFFILPWTYSFCHTALQNLPLKKGGICLTPWLGLGHATCLIE